MLKRMKTLRNEKGLTLIELLVVIVILGIIAAIAVVAIGGILENSKKDAVLGSAQQMVSAAKLGVAAGEWKPGNKIPLKKGTGDTVNGLIDAGYLDKFTIDGDSPDDPDNKITGFVKVEGENPNNYTYHVYLETTKYTLGNSNNGTDITTLERKDVTEKKNP